MKIAILCAGRISNNDDVNTIYKQYENIKENVIQDNDVDFFVSHSPELGEDIDTFCKLYQPKTFNNEPIEYVDVSAYPHLHSPHATICMFYNRSRVFHDFEKYVQENKVQYDLIINHRIDTLTHEKLMCNQFDIQNNNAIYIPKCNGFSCKQWTGISDQFALGQFDSMKHYMCIYDRMIEYLDEIGIIMGEVIVKYCLKKNNVEVVRFPFSHKINR